MKKEFSLIIKHTAILWLLYLNVADNIKIFILSEQSENFKMYTYKRKGIYYLFVISCPNN